MSEQPATIEKVFKQFEKELRSLLEPTNDKTKLAIHEHINSQNNDLSISMEALEKKFGKELASKLAPILAPIIELLARNPGVRENLQRILLPMVKKHEINDPKHPIAPPHVS